MPSVNPHISLPQPLSRALAELIAERFRLLSDPTRLRLLDLLRAQPATVGALADELQTTQQNVSKHLKLLADAGMVGRERRGTSLVCSIADPMVFALCELVCDGIRRSNANIEALFTTPGDSA